MKNYPLPSDERLEGLIKEVFESAPGPEMAQVYRLEERLLRRPPAVKTRQGVNNVPWGIVLLLSAGMASAAWMASEPFFVKEKEININIETDENGDTETFLRTRSRLQNNKLTNNNSVMMMIHQSYINVKNFS